jgi:hypothetical protein
MNKKIISLIIFLGLVMFVLFISGIKIFFDFPSLLIVIVGTFIPLIKGNNDKEKLYKSMQISGLGVGILGTLIGLASYFSQTDIISYPVLTVAMLSSIYGFISFLIIEYIK